MTQAGANTPANHFGGTFGPNEWLVQEMYERYQQDPASVDKAWWDFFADFKGGSNNGAKSNGAVNQKGVPPIPKAQQSAAPVAQQVQQLVATPAVPVAPTAPTAPTAPATPMPTSRLAPTPSDIALSTAKPADPVVKPIPTLVSPGAATVEPLRGVSARVVQSMEASLTVPTATSVRAVPAKLMIDNRTVINNHLKRGRGGKVSFTHLIGYAMIF